MLILYLAQLSQGQFGITLDTVVTFKKNKIHLGHALKQKSKKLL